jgi:hypothetical protein
MKKLLGIIIMLTFTTGFAYSVDLVDSTNMEGRGMFAENGEWTEMFSFKMERNPRIDLIYGFTSPNYHKDYYSGEFSATNIAELRLGFESFEQYKNSENVFKFNHETFFIGKIQEISTTSDDNNGKVRTEAWRFGFGRNNGYGYNIGSSMKVALGASNGLSWTKFDFLDNPESPADQKRLDYIGDSFRFGTQTEANITVKFSDNIGISGSYERAVVFPRHLFWYWAGSEIVRGIGSGLLGTFVKEVGKASPEALPIVNFVLQNALNYGFYELRQKNMNWPIETAAPFAFDSFNIGLSVSF